MLQLAPDDGLGAVGRSPALLRQAARPLPALDVNLRDMWRGSVHDIGGLGDALLRGPSLLPETQRWCLARPDDEGFACGVDDVLGEARQLVDLDEAVDLGEEALDEAEVQRLGAEAPRPRGAGAARPTVPSPVGVGHR